MRTSMPLYDYHCATCGTDKEISHPINELDTNHLCAVCNEKMERVVSCTTFALKGSGWYADGYEKNRPKAKEKAMQKQTSSERQKH